MDNQSNRPNKKVRDLSGLIDEQTPSPNFKQENTQNNQGGGEVQNKEVSNQVDNTIKSNPIIEHKSDSNKESIQSEEKDAKLKLATSEGLEMKNLDDYFADNVKFQNDKRENVPLYGKNLTRINKAVTAFKSVKNKKASMTALINNIVDQWCETNKDELNKMLKQMHKDGF